MDEAKKILRIPFPTYDHATLPLQPGKESLNKPTARIATQSTAVLSLGLASIRAMRSDHFDSFLLQLLIQRLAIVGFISNQIFRFGFDQVKVKRQLYSVTS